MENGAIKGHAPLIAVADHLRDNKLVAPFVNIKELRDRLADVRFARLENQVEIRDGAVHIPVMEVSRARPWTSSSAAPTGSMTASTTT